MAQFREITRAVLLVLLGSFSLWCGDLDEQLRTVLQQAGFTGKIQSTLVWRS